MILAWFGFPHLIMGKILVSSVIVDWRVRGGSQDFSLSSFKSFPGKFLEVIGTSPFRSGREEEETSVNLYLIFRAVLVLWKVLFLPVSQLPFIPMYSLKPVHHASFFPQLGSSLVKYHSLRIYIILLLCLENGQIRLENQTSGSATLFLFPEV